MMTCSYKLCVYLWQQWHAASLQDTHPSQWPARPRKRCSVIACMARYRVAYNWVCLPPDLAQVTSLDKAGEYRHQVDTQRLGVPYYVRSMAALDKSHPPGSRARRAVVCCCGWVDTLMLQLCSLLVCSTGNTSVQPLRFDRFSP